MVIVEFHVLSVVAHTSTCRRLNVVIELRHTLDLKLNLSLFFFHAGHGVLYVVFDW